ncbi:hypothetical protein CWI37_0258p0010 [Hamiltosporidium tvaerminnensis]|uniref:Uncharacterized protein n=1 Tax=Hamiltosporidium tvaerminnensis TaxID=1176355 RepID=A0A4Q9L7W0_9MICR|nr:hypothetical protein CWI37_0258p0010 [Hamiltosporidium tvaerminnensis]
MCFYINNTNVSILYLFRDLLKFFQYPIILEEDKADRRATSIKFETQNNIDGSNTNQCRCKKKLNEKSKRNNLEKAQQNTISKKVEQSSINGSYCLANKLVCGFRLDVSVVENTRLDDGALF